MWENISLTLKRKITKHFLKQSVSNKTRLNPHSRHTLSGIQHTLSPKLNMFSLIYPKVRMQQLSIIADCTGLLWHRDEIILFFKAHHFVSFIRLLPLCQ